MTEPLDLARITINAGGKILQSINIFDWKALLLII